MNVQEELLTAQTLPLGSVRDICVHHYWLGVLSVSTYSAWGVLVPNKAACVGVENDKMRVQG